MDKRKLIIKQSRPGRVISFEEIRKAAPSNRVRAEIARAVFDKGATIKTSTGKKIKADDADTFVEGLTASLKKFEKRTGKQRGGHNKVSDKDREKARKFWKDPKLTVRQVEDLTGYSYSAMRGWFGPRRG